MLNTYKAYDTYFWTKYPNPIFTTLEDTYTFTY